MISVRHPWVGLALALLVLVALAPAAQAQSVTTGNLAGSITATEQGGIIPGATVTAVHEPTGSRYTGVSGADGHYVIPNVRPGGPYKVTASAQGYKDTDVTNVEAKLGTTVEVNLSMPLAAVTETIEVVSTGDELINPNRTGSASTVSTQQIENLPTLRRSLQDFARTNPYFNVDQSDSSQTTMNVAGRNNRYNSIQIDGAANNDLFGLSATGTNGGQTDTQPISLDAVAQLQLTVSPYDVRQGGFTGGAVNVVTRSGSNDWSGSAYGSKRNESLVGDGPTGKAQTNFDQSQYGFRVGGPIRHDSLFFFVNGERNRNEAPNGTSADGSTAVVYHGNTDPSQVASVLKSKFGFDAGGLGDVTVPIESDLAFARLDWNAAPGEQIVLRHNYVKGDKFVVGTQRDAAHFRFDSAMYTMNDKTNQTVVQVNSVLGKFYNEARLGYTKVQDFRAPAAQFPGVEVGGSGNRNGDVVAGGEQFSGANSLDQDVTEITDDLTLLHGTHTFTIGTHNEIFTFSNLFLSSFFGMYFFPNVAALQANTPSQYFVTFPNPGQPAAISFHARQYGIYGSDQWRVNERFSLTYGLRIDKPSYPDTPPFNANVQSKLGINTSNTPNEDPVISPRIGFNWDPTGKGKDQLRGGIGIFAGRTPYVWVSNAYGGTGITSTSLSCLASAGCTPPPLTTDINNQPHAGSGPAAIGIDTVNPDFKFPRTLRTTLGYDRELWWGIRGTAEVLYSQTQEDIFYLNLNKHRVGTSPLDGRPTFATTSTSFATVTQLTNTTKGDETVESIQLTKTLSHGFSVWASYAHMDTSTAMDGGSSTASSQWQFRPNKGDITLQDTARSLFEVEHRFVVAPSYTFQTGPVTHSLSLFYNVQSGRPYSLLVGGDPNTDGAQANDLLFVPAAANAIILKDVSGNVISYDVFAHFLKSAGISATAGRILSRNESTEPWLHQLDLHYGVEVPIKFTRAEVDFDVLNFLNMLNSDWGVDRNTGLNQTYTPVNYKGIDAATGKPIYQAATATSLNPGNQFQLTDIRSRWQGKITLRLSF